MRDAALDRQSLYRYSTVNRPFLNLIYHLDTTSMSYDRFCSFDVAAEVSSQNAFLTCFLETQAAGQHRSLQVSYGITSSTKTDIGPARW